MNYEATGEKTGTRKTASLVAEKLAAQRLYPLLNFKQATL